MSYQHSTSGIVDLDTVFKVFGAVGIAIGIVLSVVVVLVSTPVGEFVADSPGIVGTAVFSLLLLSVAALLARGGRQ